MVKFSIITVFIFILLLVFGDNHPQNNVTTQFSGSRKGVAIIMTGAAARIPQEAALLEELYRRGLLKDLVFISGVSSGALNAVILNGIMSRKMSWNNYKKILFDMKSSDIFIQEGKKIPVNTTPARELYRRVVEGKLGYRNIGELPYPTSLSFTRLLDFDLKPEVYRMCSRDINKESDPTLSLVDIMMASSAFPLVFPSVRISNVTSIPDVKYVDGGVGEDHVPYKALLEFEQFRKRGVEKVYIISRKSDSIPQVSEELRSLGINDRGLFDRAGISLDAILKKGIIKRLESYLEEAPELADRTFIWIPDFEENFPLFGFDKMKDQYDITSKWAKNHNPVPLKEFMAGNAQNERKSIFR
jgi:predicted acylesterase/phospholipase RssA